MRILLYQWDAYSERALERALKSAGLEFDTYRRIVKHQICDPEFSLEFECVLASSKADIVLSFNFFPLVSELCKKYHRKYVAWIFSSPHFSLYCDIAHYDGNYIFCFDRYEFQELKGRGFRHVYHLPLASDWEMFQKTIERGDTHAAGSQISFVGTLYTDERNYFEQIAFLPERVRGYIDGLCEAQMKIYGYNIIREAIGQEIMNELKRYIAYDMDDDFSLPFEKFIETTIQKRITILERSRLLMMLGKEFAVDVYTGSDTSGLKGVASRGYIHYYDEMPSVFHRSKINLNITLRSIGSGIPLRVMDVLACGGFLMTNYQPEIEEHFVDGEHLAVYGSQEELLDKCNYYLSHDDIRKEIAQKGYLAVKSQFSYERQLKKMLDIVRYD